MASNYEELIKALRLIGKEQDCNECEAGRWHHDFKCCLFEDAAAAIEALQAENETLHQHIEDLNGAFRSESLARQKAEVAQPHWVSVEEPPKKEGKYIVAYGSSVVYGYGYDMAYYTKHLEDAQLMIPVPENSEGWFNWSDYNDCDVLVCPDYWMPIEPPQEEEHGN